MELWTIDLGAVDYRAAHELQERVRDARRAELIPDTLLLLEHPPVYTRGRRSQPGELAMGEQWYRERGIEIVDVRRGGKVTYHGPGQLVGYPIARVGDVIGFVRTMERAIGAALADVGLPGAGGRPAEGPDYTGVWIEDRKIASIGIHVRHGIATHGFAINVDNDLAPFGWVVACGLPGVTMTSVATETGVAGGLGALRERVVARFCEQTGHVASAVEPKRLAQTLACADGAAQATDTLVRR